MGYLTPEQYKDLTLFIGGIICVFLFLLFCIPFFVFKIRNEVVAIRKKLQRLIDLKEKSA